MLTRIAGGLLAAAIAAAPQTAASQTAAPQTDTTFAVEPGARLEVRNNGGDIVVRTWNRNQVRIQAEHSSRTEVRVQNAGSVVRVDARGRMGPANIVDYQITVPASMRLDLSGLHTDVNVEGSQAEVAVQTVQGDVTVRGGRGAVTVRTVQGDASVQGAQGTIRAASTSGDARVAESSGDVYAETVSGEIYLERITSPRVEAVTVSGDVYYDGDIQPRGSYSFVTHSGDVFASVPERADVTVSVGTLSGELEASFPIPARDREGGRRHTFNLGSGSARLELETFSGDVQLRRPGEVSAALATARARAEAREQERRNRAPRAPRPPRPAGPGIR